MPTARPRIRPASLHPGPEPSTTVRTLLPPPLPCW
ncbi:hypothetical protein LB507_005935 [Fusarium sp. FIESC RH6]|nr:hypothetical protein LB507_005935 [Fusarium sp. FIESC RH6]